MSEILCDHEGCLNAAKYHCDESGLGNFYLCEHHFTSWMRDRMPLKLRDESKQEQP